MKKYLVVVILSVFSMQARVIHSGSDASMHWAIQRAQIDQIRRRRAREYRKKNQKTTRVKRQQTQGQRTEQKRRKQNNFH